MSPGIMQVERSSRGILVRKENTRALEKHTQIGTSGNTKGQPEIGPWGLTAPESGPPEYLATSWNLLVLLRESANSLSHQFNVFKPVGNVLARDSHASSLPRHSHSRARFFSPSLVRNRFWDCISTPGGKKQNCSSRCWSQESPFGSSILRTLGTLGLRSA